MSQLSPQVFGLRASKEGGTVLNSHRGHITRAASEELGASAVVVVTCILEQAQPLGRVASHGAGV